LSHDSDKRVLIKICYYFQLIGKDHDDEHGEESLHNKILSIGVHQSETKVMAIYERYFHVYIVSIDLSKYDILGKVERVKDAQVQQVNSSIFVEMTVQFYQFHHLLKSFYQFRFQYHKAIEEIFC